MAVYYNPYMPQGTGTPVYYNPYQQLTGYSGTVNYPVLKPESIATDIQVMKWVEGEVGAKAFQMPAGWPANQPYPLWDSTDTIIYLKSWNQMGMPNPLQKIKYVMMEEQPQMSPEKLNGMSGATASMNQNGPTGAGEYASKTEFEALRQEIQDLKETALALQASLKASTPQTNQNSSRNMNRGGNNNG